MVLYIIQMTNKFVPYGSFFSPIGNIHLYSTFIKSFYFYLFFKICFNPRVFKHSISIGLTIVWFKTKHNSTWHQSLILWQYSHLCALLPVASSMSIDISLYSFSLENCIKKKQQQQQQHLFLRERANESKCAQVGEGQREGYGESEEVSRP